MVPCVGGSSAVSLSAVISFTVSSFTVSSSAVGSRGVMSHISRHGDGPDSVDPPTPSFRVERETGVGRGGEGCLYTGSFNIISVQQYPRQSSQNYISRAVVVLSKYSLIITIAAPTPTASPPTTRPIHTVPPETKGWGERYRTRHPVTDSVVRDRWAADGARPETSGRGGLTSNAQPATLDRRRSTRDVRPKSSTSDEYHGRRR